MSSYMKTLQNKILWGQFQKQLLVLKDFFHLQFKASLKSLHDSSFSDFFILNPDFGSQ